MITKLEFINRYDVSLATPTVLKTYTNIYEEPKLSPDENSSPVSYFIKTPRGIDLVLIWDDFLRDDVYDSANDVQGLTESALGLSDKAIKVYEDDVYVYLGLILTDDNLNHKIDKDFITIKTQSPMVLVAKNGSEKRDPIDDISSELDDMFYYISLSFSETPISNYLPLIQDFTPKGSIYWDELQIGDLDDGVSVGNTGSYLGAFFSDDVNYLDIVRVWGIDIDIGGEPEYRYRYKINTFEKTVQMGSSTALFTTLAALNAELTTLGYTSTSTSIGDLQFIKSDENETYDAISYYDPLPGTYIIKFSGYDFLESLNYKDGEHSYNEILDSILTINNLQIQMDYSLGYARFKITNKDEVLTDRGTIDPNDMSDIVEKRNKIDDIKFEKFNILIDAQIEDIEESTRNYYRQFTLNTNRKISFLLSEVKNTYGLELDDKFTYDIADYKVSRISNEEDKFFNVEAVIISKHIGVDNPNGGEVYKPTANIGIIWRTISINSTENVKIELWKNDVYSRTITASTSNDGYYAWSLSGVSDSSKYKIKIILISDTDIFDFSDDYFSVATP